MIDASAREGASIGVMESFVANILTVSLLMDEGHQRKASEGDWVPLENAGNVCFPGA